MAAIAASCSQDLFTVCGSEVKALLDLERRGQERCLDVLADVLGYAPKLDHP